MDRMVRTCWTKNRLRLCRLLMAAFLSAVFGLGGLPCAQAQTYNEAYQQYIKSDYKGAIAILNKIVKSAYAKDELALAYKLLGIVHYMEGNKKAAAAAFRMALRNEPNIAISPGEVLDETVVEFFADQKTIMEDEVLTRRIREEDSKMKTTGSAPGGAAGKNAAKGAGAAGGEDQVGLDAGPPAPKGKEPPAKPKKVVKNTKFAPEKIPAPPKSKAPVATAGGFSIVQLLPFGIGQFYNHAYVLGALFGAAEAGTLVGYYILNENINKAVANSDAIQDDPRYSQPEKDSAYATAISYSKSRHDMQTYCIIGFFGLWGLEALEAVFLSGAKKPVVKGVAGDGAAPARRVLAITPLPVVEGDHVTFVPGLTLQLHLN